MRQLNTLGIARCAVQVETELLTFLKFNFVVLENANAQLWPLQVGKNSYWSANLRFDFSDDTVTLSNLRMASVTHVQPKYVGSGIE